jgi:hypothetical protein
VLDLLDERRLRPGSGSVGCEQKNPELVNHQFHADNGFLSGNQTKKIFGWNPFLYQAIGVLVNARRALVQPFVMGVTVDENSHDRA